MPYRDMSGGAVERIVRPVTKDDPAGFSYSLMLDEPFSRSGQLLPQQLTRGERILLAKWWGIGSVGRRVGAKRCHWLKPMGHLSAGCSVFPGRHWPILLANGIH